VCVGYLGGELDWIPRSPALRGNEESSPRKRRTARSSHRAAGGCGATGGPRCQPWQRGPGTQPLVVQGLAGPRKARCHALQGWQRGLDRPGQTATAQRACPGRFPVRRASKDGTRSLLPPLRGGTRNLPQGKDAHPASAGSARPRLAAKRQLNLPQKDGIPTPAGSDTSRVPSTRRRHARIRPIRVDHAETGSGREGPATAGGRSTGRASAHN
jgi:hypothetical protein